jgi:hypothetical protein
MMQSKLQRSGLGLLAVLLFLLFSSALAWGDHHEKKDQKGLNARANETTEEKVSRLAHELADLLARGVEVYETAEPQETALQQRQRDAARGGLVRARDAALELVGDLDAGGNIGSSVTYFRTADGNMQDALETAGDFEPIGEGAQIIGRVEEIFRKLRRIYDEG